MDGSAGRVSRAQDLVLALRRLNRAAVVSNRTVAAHLGIKEGDFAVLDLLSQEGPLTPTELARATGTHVATMTGVLARLERDGWIERRATHGDRRSVQIHATGTERLTAQFDSVNAQIADLVADLSEARLRELTGLLSAVSDITLDAAAQVREGMPGE